jgi:two-component system chemotaxis response regulator CheB
VSERIRILVVDDSVTIRDQVAHVLRGGEFQIAGAADADEARAQVRAFDPHVLVLDLELPGEDGLAYLSTLMLGKPRPVVVYSATAPQGSERAVRALELGALEIIEKKGPLDEARFIELLRAAAASRPRRYSMPPPRPTPLPLDNLLADRVFAVGASTGGPAAIACLLQRLPRGAMPGVVVQHMPAAFISEFVKRLRRVCEADVRQAADGDELTKGVVLIAPGDRHLIVERDGTRLYARVTSDPPVNRMRPSVDLLFSSLAQELHGAAAGVLLTGVGSDGALGLLRLRQAGAMTICEDVSTASVFALPKEAIDRGAASKVLALDRIAPALLDWMSKPVA